MKYLLSDSTDPFYNLAMEEYVFKNSKPHEDIVILWQNEPTIVIGLHQNALEEINLDFVKKNNIHVVRRITGGGAVYHDLGNLNFSFITDYDNNTVSLNFKKYTLPIIKALKKLGIQSELSGRNDITIDGKKFSGNAQSIIKGRILHHGTLLFNSDLSILGKALNVKSDKIESKGVKSVKSRVTNIINYMNNMVSVEEFKTILLKYLFEYEPLDQYILTENDKHLINKLMEEKYLTWKWVYGRTPKFNFKNYKRFDGGSIEVLLNIENGYISECSIFGDFLSLISLQEVLKKLEGCKYEKEEVKDVLKNIKLHEYFGSITLDDILEVFFDS
ncbi:MAG: lipoyltransferase and lipoate-protein ligase [Clostridiaceae bacterium]|jgi:lipoate-protein ligase A|nr:lipoyltransferase and lipoate-protein ligase [Clostridiaceae bacterium]